MSPGTLVYSGDRSTNDTANIKFRIFDYNEVTLQERDFTNVEECFPYRDINTVSWINLDGVHDVSNIQKLGEHFQIHPLVLEDILHTNQRPKLDEHDDYLFIVLKMLDYDDQRCTVNSEQISLIVTKTCVISFQENPGDVFDPIRERLRSSKGRLRKCGADYLAYALIDAIVDHYFLVLEKLGERIQIIEDSILDNPSPQMAHTVHILKQETISVRKAIWPLREVVNALERLESDLMSAYIDPYLRDLYDHTVQVIDAVESYRDILSSMLEIYLATISNKMNEVMKVLTIISTIFIPLTFIAGVYGMNFKHMPELEWQYGYPLSIALMAAIALGLLAFFRSKKWL